MAIRHWSRLRLAATWVAAGLACVVVWRVLAWGTIQGRVIDLTSSEISGQWSPSFAAGATTFFVVVTSIVLLVVTGLWLRGREERAKRRLANGAADNRILVGPPRPGTKKARKKFFQR